MDDDLAFASHVHATVRSAPASHAAFMAHPAAVAEITAFAC
jgi:hypothetical protein